MPRAPCPVPQLLLKHTMKNLIANFTLASALLATGAAQAVPLFNLGSSTLFNPPSQGVSVGTVLVDDPGYPNLMYMLRFLGARVIGVPRTPNGYDLAALEALLVEHRPKAFFTQPRLQSPTNSVTPVAQLFRVLQLAG